LVKETLIIEAGGRTLSEVDRVISRGIGALRCPEHGSGVTYEPPAFDTATAIDKVSFSVDVICCCEELLRMARNAAAR
jgi:hypothetical protein